jgi:CDP-4-dehydro-6-deoxyglucose reductase
MLHHIHNHQQPHQNIHLIFGTRGKSDLLYLEELRRLESEMEGFQFIPTLSREQWDGCCGYVHAVYENLVNGKKDGENLPPAQFYLCGWKAMVDEAKHRILDLGYDKKDIHLELYG